MDTGINIIKNFITKMKLNEKIGEIYSNSFKDNRLLMSIIVGNIVVYIIFTLLSTFFKLPIVLFLGTSLGLWVYMRTNNKKQNKVK